MVHRRAAVTDMPTYRTLRGGPRERWRTLDRRFHGG